MTVEQIHTALAKLKMDIIGQIQVRQGLIWVLQATSLECTVGQDKVLSVGKLKVGQGLVWVWQGTIGYGRAQ